MKVIILEPVGSACNLRCVYCYQEPVRDKLKVMSRSLLEKIISEASMLNDEVKFIWHGGEPLLADLGFFKDVVDLQNQYFSERKRMNSIQTNATLITPKWAQFLVNNDFRVSTSLDGPKWLHDLSRCGSFEKTVAGIQQIRKLTNRLGVIITVHKLNVDFPEIIWNEVIKPKIFSESFDVNLVSPTESKSLTPSDEKAYHFLKTVFDLWMENDDPKIYIRSFMSILRGLKGGKPHLCAFEYKKCDQFIAIDNFADAYMCNRFLKRNDALVGNIFKSPLTSLLKAKKEIYSKLATLNDECTKCEWFSMCGSGCIYYKWASSGKFGGACPECNIRKRFFSYIKNRYLLT